MAPRANWKGFLRLSLVTCPIALFWRPQREKVSFNQINKNTGHRIKYAKVDAETGEEVSNDDRARTDPDRRRPEIRTQQAWPWKRMSPKQSGD